MPRGLFFFIQRKQAMSNTEQNPASQPFAFGGTEALPLTPPQYINDQRDTRVDQVNSALQYARPDTADSITAAAIPDDFKVEDLEQFMPTRRRAAGVMTTPFINDFVTYVEEHKQAGCTIFVDADQMQGRAVLDLGTPTTPGHCANIAALAPKATAAFASLKSVIDRQRNQKDTAEWLEDWVHILKAQADGKEVDMRKAIQAVRSITIEGLNKVHHEEQSLSASRSAFESVKASSEETLPTHFLFKCKPYPDLKERDFVLRLSVVTDTKPMLVLRPMAWETAVEEMATEFATDIRKAVENKVPVLIGTYSKK